jgi:protein farnesyltransferase subunit beta
MQADAFESLWFECEEVEGPTYAEQCACERQCANFLVPFSTYSPEVLEKFRAGALVNADNEIRLLRDKHAEYLTAGLSKDLVPGFVSLDASRPWICYWILHALYLLDKEPVHLYPRVIATLASFQQPQPHWVLSELRHKDVASSSSSSSSTTTSSSSSPSSTTTRDGWAGGFGGGPQHLPHGAPTYASTLALCTVGTPEALAAIDRRALYRLFLSLKCASGGFRIHMDGETDSRGTYTILSVARLTNILTPELVAGTADYLLRCQSYEGGFGGEPGNEAHGGYNFCALAGLLILGEAHRCDLDGQERWLLQRQVRLEGGFQGRTNKLVDSCYSFWQGAASALVEMARRGGSDVSDLHAYLAARGADHGSGAASASASSVATALDRMSVSPDDVEEAQRILPATATAGTLPFNQMALQRYILHCAQQTEGGGLRDKPGKSRDFYHTCYSLSGLAIAQHFTLDGVGGGGGGPTDALPNVFGDPSNLVRPTSAVYNIGFDKLHFALNYFAGQVSTHAGLLG